MKVLRIYIKGWTASYRFPPFVVAVQPSLPVPPLSTIYGIISAATGRLVGPQETSVGFVAPCKAKAKDLERLYQVGEGGKIEKTSIVNREFIHEPELYLYLTNLSFEPYFLSPRYPILLGRSCDLASVREVRIVELQPAKEADFQYTILPFPFEGIATPFFALAVAFDESVPRRPIKVRGFHIVEKPTRISGENIFIDPEKGWGVFMHDGVR